MNISNLNRMLVKIDNFCDYVPFVSPITNVVDLFQKCVILPRMQKSTIQASHYYRHLDQKSFARCILLVIPVFGNIIIGIYDFSNRRYNNKESILAVASQKQDSFKSRPNAIIGSSQAMMPTIASATTTTSTRIVGSYNPLSSTPFSSASFLLPNMLSSTPNSSSSSSSSSSLSSRPTTTSSSSFVPPQQEELSTTDGKRRVNANFSSIPVAVLGTILSFDPNNIHLFTQISKKCLCASRDPAFIYPYFQELRTSLGQERLNQLLDRVNWEPSKASLDELTKTVYQNARITDSGRKLLEGKHGILPASQLANIVKLRDKEEEEDANLVKIAPHLFNNSIHFMDALYTSIVCSGKIEKEVLHLKAQAVRMAIANMRNRDSIESLSFQDLELTSIPQEIFLFTNLRTLMLGNNQITTVPVEIGKLVNLELLGLHHNRLTTVPIEMHNLVNLEMLFLQNNLLKTFPLQIGSFAKLDKLYLWGNDDLILSAESGLSNKQWVNLMQKKA